MKLKCHHKKIRSYCRIGDRTFLANFYESHLKKKLTVVQVVLRGRRGHRTGASTAQASSVVGQEATASEADAIKKKGNKPEKNPKKIHNFFLIFNSFNSLWLQRPWRSQQPQDYSLVLLWLRPPSKADAVKKKSQFKKKI